MGYNPKEFYIKLYDKLTFEEREHLKTLIDNKSCVNCTNGSCSVCSYEKVGVDEFGRPQGSYCLGWSNPELVGRQKVLTINTKVPEKK